MLLRSLLGVFRITLFLTSIFSAISVAISVSGNDLVEYTINKNQLINSEFSAIVDRYGDSMSKYQSHLTNVEIKQKSGCNTFFILTGVSGKDGAVFGEPPPGGYLLACYRGDGDYEYYSSWSRQSTASVDSSDYYVFGSRRASLLTSITVCATSLLGWIVLGRFKRRYSAK